MMTTSIVLSIVIFLSGCAANRCYQEPCSCCSSGICNMTNEGKQVCNGCIDGRTGSSCEEPCPPGCASCSQTNIQGGIICFACRSGYYDAVLHDATRLLNQKNCAPCKTGCESCTSDKNCSKCMEGFHMSIKGECAKCSDNCANCQSLTECKTCMDGYFLLENSCYPCMRDCKTCSSSFHCSECSQEFFLNGTLCEPCASNCLACNSSTSCNKCLKGYYLNNRECLPCKSNCEVCSGPSYTCISCKDGFYRSQDICDECAPGCAFCRSKSYCSVCKQGYRYVNSSCIFCPAGCKSCSADNHCTSCENEYYLDSSLCKKCSVSCLNGKCSAEDGTCVNGCVTETWGARCEHNCNISCGKEYGCDQHNGACIVNCVSVKEDKCLCPGGCICQLHKNCSTCKIGYRERCEYNCSNECNDSACKNQREQCLKERGDGQNDKHASTSGTENKTSLWLTVGIPVIVSVIIVIIIIGVILYRKRQKNKQKKGPGARQDIEFRPLPQDDKSQDANTTDPRDNFAVADGDVDQTLAVKTEQETVDVLQCADPKTNEPDRVHSGDNCQDVPNRSMSLENKGGPEEVKNAVTSAVDKPTAEQVAVPRDAIGKHDNQHQAKHMTERLELSESSVTEARTRSKTLQELRQSGSQEFTEELKREYENMSKGKTKEQFPPEDPDKMKKDRLTVVDGKELNAYFISVKSKIHSREASTAPQKYICFSGPKSSYKQIETSWMLILQEKCNKVLVLNHSKQKNGNISFADFCKKRRFDDISIDPEPKQAAHSDYVQVVKVKNGSELRRITLVKVNLSQDGIPEDVDIFNKLEDKMNEQNILVYCGCRKAETCIGTVIAFDELRREGNETGSVSVYNCVEYLREESGGKMFNKVEQYLWLHKALKEALDSESKSPMREEMQQKYRKKHRKKLEREWEKKQKP